MIPDLFFKTVDLGSSFLKRRLRCDRHNPFLSFAINDWMIQALSLDHQSLEGESLPLQGFYLAYSLNQRMREESFKVRVNPWLDCQRPRRKGAQGLIVWPLAVSRIVTAHFLKSNDFIKIMKSHLILRNYGLIARGNHITSKRQSCAADKLKTLWLTFKSVNQQ